MADHGLTDDGLDDVLLLRGLLQCIAIGLFFTTRYILDVLFSPSAVRGLCRVGFSVFARTWMTARWASLAALVVLYFWCAPSISIVAARVTKYSILGATLGAIMGDAWALLGLKKRHVWLPLAWFVTFTRISSGQEAPQGAWRAGLRRFLCCAMPWFIRLCILSMLLVSWPANFGMAPLHHYALPSDSVDALHVADKGGFLPSAPLLKEIESQHHQACTSFIGYPVPCDELRRVREFNGKVMPGLRNAGYHTVRRAMNAHGLLGHAWHVGHACPDPSKKTTRNKEDFGHNLIAQHAADNLRLGHCLISCAEADHLGASHVQCTRSKLCIPACDRISKV